MHILILFSIPVLGNIPVTRCSLKFRVSFVSVCSQINFLQIIVELTMAHYNLYKDFYVLFPGTTENYLYTSG